jgi:pimeloyl-ACP methyl ester carboxylesterase
MDREELLALAHESLKETDDDFGYHAGYRAAQAKGTLCRGVFISNGRASALTSAVHLQRDTVTPVTVRFSNSATNPVRHDGTFDVRSMAATFHLPDGERTDMLGLRMPLFFVGNANQFLAWQRAMRKGMLGDLPQPRWGRLIYSQLTGKVPKKMLRRQVRPLCRIPSYASCRYNSLHAFKWIPDGDNGTHHVRYSWVPCVPEEAFRLWEWRCWYATRREPDYLRTELAERLARSGARFRLEAQLAGPGDNVDDASAEWSPDGERLDVGTLELSEPGRWGSSNGQLRFDPMRLTPGIEAPSGDTLLQLRKYVYQLSAERRRGKEQEEERPCPVVLERSDPKPGWKHVNGVDICFRRSGNGNRPLLLIMGFACPMTWWTPAFRAKLEQKGFGPIWFDSRDCGQSTHINATVGKLRALLSPGQLAPYDVDDMADDAAGLLDALEVQRAHVMGISLGGMVAQALAIKRPEQVISLTSINSCPRTRKWPPSRWPTLRVAKRLVTPRSTKSEQDWVDSSLPLWRLLGGGRLAPEDERNVDDLLHLQWSWSGGSDPEADFRQMLAVLAAGDRTSDLKKLKMPTLVIQGTKDPLIRPAGGRDTHSAIEGSRWLPLEMGHYTPIGTWDDIIGAIDKVATAAERGA